MNKGSEYVNEETYTPACSSESKESHWDLYSIYEFLDEPPEEILALWRKNRKFRAAMYAPVFLEIGKTSYGVYSVYAGSEPILGKMKRLLFNDPLTQKAVSA